MIDYGITYEERAQNAENSLRILKNVITEAFQEIQRCPDDSMHDIFNEKLKRWGMTGIRMNSQFQIDSV